MRTFIKNYKINFTVIETYLTRFFAPDKSKFSSIYNISLVSFQNKICKSRMLLNSLIIFFKIGAKNIYSTPSPKVNDCCFTGFTGLQDYFDGLYIWKTNLCVCYYTFLQRKYKNRRVIYLLLPRCWQFKYICSCLI